MSAQYFSAAGYGFRQTALFLNYRPIRPYCGALCRAARGGVFLEQEASDIATLPAATACNVLMIYPRFMADSFWNFSEACELVGARYPAIPLGLITVAALLPKSWNVRLVNRNTEELSESDLAWAAMVMTGGMLFQQADTLDHIESCRARGLPVAVGGPDVSASPHR